LYKKLNSKYIATEKETKITKGNKLLKNIKFKFKKSKMKRRLPNMKNLVNRLLVEEEGQGMTEYALVLGVIAIGAIALITAFRTQVTNLWTSITNQITGAVTTVNSTPAPVAP